MCIPRNPLWIAASLLALAAAPLAPRQDVRFGDPIQGQRLFVDKGCVRCHAVRGAGGRIGPDLGRKTTRNSFYEIAALMWNHSPGMAGKMEEYRVTRAAFEEDELSDLISFLHFLNYFDEPGDPRAGRILFTEKLCVRCHKVGEEGGSAGPPLDTIPRDIAPLHIAGALWNHGPEMISAIRASGLEVPKFADTEIIDLFAYLRSQGARQGSPRFQSPGDPTKGREVFDDKGCGACHPVFGEEPGVAPDLGRAELRGSVTQIAGRMWNHWPDMARTMQAAGMSVPQFKGDELLDLFAYVYIARYEGESGDPERGAAVYVGRGCSVCHGPQGQGNVGPALRDLTPGVSRERIMQSMWNHAPQMGAHLIDQNLSWVRLSAGELADLLAFLSRGWGDAAVPAEK
jgi:mono/diheme cytochrome c family protein